METEDDVVAVLNTTPTLAGVRTDQLLDGSGPVPAVDLVRGWGGSGDPAEIRALAWARDQVQHIVAGGEAAAALPAGFDGVTRRPRLTAEGLQWDTHAPELSRLALEFLESWTELASRWPGRLRACANGECSLYLLDRSRGNAARWCSMTTCGNRMKARRHVERSRRPERG